MPLAFSCQDIDLKWLGQIRLVVQGSFTSVLDKSELAVTNRSSLCAIWDPIKRMF